MKTTKQILYQKVEDAREQDLLKKIEKAMDYALEVEAPGEIISKLHKAKNMVNRSEGFDTIRVEAKHGPNNKKRKNKMPIL
jgi:hypothetical protein